MKSQPSPRNLLGEIAKTASRLPADAPQCVVDGDFYKIAHLVSAEDQALLRRVRAFAEEKIAPIINQYWGRAEFPFELISEYGALGIAGVPYSGFGCLGKSVLLDGLIMMELARVDCSIATFHGVHSGLAMGSIYLCGSDEQRQRWLPAMQQAGKIGAFALTERRWIRRSAGTNDNRPVPRQELDLEWTEAVDRQCYLCRLDGYLGSRCRRRSSQGFRGRERHPRPLDRKDETQDGAPRRPKCDHQPPGLPCAGRQSVGECFFLQGYSSGAAYDARWCCLGSRRMRPGGLRARIALCLSARAIRSADCRISTCAGSACAHAIECDGVSMHGAPSVAIAGRWHDEGRTRLIGQGFLHRKGARDGWLGARAARRKWYPAGSSRRPLCR